MSTSQYRTLAYGAGASLAAATLVYVFFGPTYFLDSSAAGSSRRRTAVGLANPANDCFINCILQSLAGLPHLRTYLSHRVRLATLADTPAAEDPFLTAALKEVLDALNERPLYRKTISNRSFLRELERVFKQPISRQQQDAHEFLQVVAETLEAERLRMEKEEGRRRRERERRRREEDADGGVRLDGGEREEEMEGSAVILDNPVEREEVGTPEKEEAEEEAEEEVEERVVDSRPMPLEGKLESEIECMTCGFKPKPTVSTFVVLTLPVPQKSSTTLNECIEGTLSTETIDDYQCAKCRLLAAISVFSTYPANPKTERALASLRNSLETDPENPPADIPLPSPKSKIAKRTMMKEYPDIIALHLSRSIFDAYSSRKNSAKVEFKEELVMGGLLDRRRYRLMCMVTHKGGHDSGHYECFRRQVTGPEPFSTPTPEKEGAEPSAPANVETEKKEEPQEPKKEENTPPELTKKAKKAAKKKVDNKWWRISDDKIKETKTAEVLDMQKEVYLLFYQRVKEDL